MSNLLNDFSFQIFRNESYYVPFTANITLIYIVEGSALIDGEGSYTLKKNDFSVINIGSRLSVCESPGSIYAVILFRYELVRRIMDTDIFRFKCNSVKENGIKYEQLRHIIGELLSEYYVDRKRMTAQKAGIFFRILHCLNNYFCSQKTELPMTGKDSRHTEIILYIWEHYAEKISLEDLAKKYFMSSSSFSRYFKSACGTPFLQYLTNIRLHFALSDLVYSEKSLTDIALDNGFSSVSLFDRIFQKTYGMSPSQYRRKINTELSNITTDEKNLDYLEPFLSKNRVTVVNETHARVREITADSSKRRRYKNPWGKMICVGRLSQLGLTEFARQLSMICPQTGILYGKIWGFFSEEALLRNGHETDNLNYNILDSAIDLLLGLRLKPLLCFENEPVGPIIDLNEYKSTAPESVFLTLDEAVLVFDRLFEHLCFRYGTEEVETWMAEFWYDEYRNNFLGLEGSITDYYAPIAECIKKRAPGLKIGGCGLGVSISEEKYRNLIRSWKRNTILPDFISVYCYPVRRAASDDLVAERLTFKDFFRKEVLADRMILDEYHMTGIPVLVTAWSLSFSDQNYFNDSCGKAALMLHIMVEEMDTVSAAAYFLLSDLSQVYSDSYRTLHGAKGLISTHGIAKPTFYAMYFINHLYPLLIDKGDNYIITVNERNRFCILLFNSKDPGYAYYSKKETEINAMTVETCFENTDDLEITLSINNVENGFYYIRMQSVSPEHGNVLSEWLKLSVNGMISADDLRYLQHQGVPYRRNNGTEVTDHTLTIIQRLVCHEMVMLEIFR